MPAAAEIRLAALVGLLDHGNDVGMYLLALDERLAAERAEILREARLVLVGHAGLIAEEQAAMRDDRAPDPGDGFAIERPGQVDARNFRAASARNLSHADTLVGHAASSRMALVNGRSFAKLPRAGGTSTPFARRKCKAEDP